MIVDNLRNKNLYKNIHSRFQQAFDFIEQAVSNNIPVGKYEIDGDNIFAFVQEYKTKLYDETKAEAHRKYIDIQFIVKGVEIIDVCDITRDEVDQEYNIEKDIEFYKGKENISIAVLREGEYGIFFPHDVHRPCISLNDEPNDVRKIVVKIKTENN